MDFAKLSPYLAGSPPAVVLAFALYNSVIGVAGPGWEYLAGAVALSGVVGMLTAEIISYRKALEALALREWGAFVFAILAALICSGLVVFAIYSGADARSLLSSVVIAVIFYAVMGVDAYLGERRSERERELRELKARTSSTRAEARLLEAGQRAATVQQAGRVSSPSSGQLDEGRLRQVYGLLAAEPSLSAREVARRMGISPTTASAYCKKVKGA